MGTLEKIRSKKGLVKGVMYTRFSSDNQRDESIDAQIRAIRDYAQKNDIMIVGEYVDRARSAMTDNRPEFLQMIADAAKKEFDVVLVHKLDRFARNRQDSIGYRMQLKRHGVSLISILEYLDSDSPESVILESVLEAMAEYYSLNLAREVRKGMHENALKGIHTGGIPPLGYNVDPETRMLVINEDEAKIVRLIFQRIVEGTGYTVLINELNALGYRSKVGNHFSNNSLNAILVNEKYVGTYVFNRSMTKTLDGKRSNKSKDPSEILKIEGVVPPIVGKDDFEKVRDIMQSRRHSQRGKVSAIEIYLLSGKIICGVCGNKYVGNRKRDGRNKALQVRYGCNRRHRGTKVACDNKEIRREYIEAFVIDKLAEQIFNEELVRVITEYYNQKIKENAGVNDSHIVALRRKSKELGRKINNILNLMADSGSNALMGKLHDLEEEQRQVGEQIARLSRKTVEYVTEEYIRELFQKGRELLQNKTLPSLKKLIQIFVDSVIIYPDSVHVLFNFSEKKYLPQHPSLTNDDAAVNMTLTEPFQDEKVVKESGGEGSRTPVRK